MLAVLYLLPFLSCGCVMARCLLPTHRPLNRLWLGCSLGLLSMMWMPALCAFALGFTVEAHLAALGLLGLATLLCFIFRDRRAPAEWNVKERRHLWISLAVVLPLTALFAYLQYTHVYRVDADGNWWVGQSTYGDLPMHTAFITGLKNASFPPEYPFYPGHRLSYPFLTDSLSTTFYLFDMSLQAATIVPAVLMFLLLAFGVMVLGRELSATKAATVLAALLFFLNGGLGFIYDIDNAGGTAYEGRTETLQKLDSLMDDYLTKVDWYQSVDSDARQDFIEELDKIVSNYAWSIGRHGNAEIQPEILNRLDTIMEGYYTTPTNQPDPNNLRWSNVIADMFVPQRTFLGGYCMVLPCLYLLWTGFGGSLKRKSADMRHIALLGVWAGALPLIHTHSFLALALCSAGFLLYDMIHGPDRLYWLKQYAIYAGITAMLALPQLFGFTFHQAFGQGENAGSSFLTFQFNWVNNRGGEGMRDLYIWFYLKNIGLPFLIVLMAVLEKNPRHRRILYGAGLIWLAAELIRFQPNEYDNNKLFYLAWLLCCFVAADWCVTVFRRLRGMRSRWALAVLCAVAFFLSAGLTLAREVVSNYEVYRKEDVAMAEWIKENTDEDAVFLTGWEEHLNPVDSIAGRTIVCGPDLWLYWHGFDTRQTHADIRRFYEDPTNNLDVLSKYGVDYISLSSTFGGEATKFDVDTNAFDELFEKVYDESGRCIYRVPEG
ncbi:MAG: hypothetical protein IK127_08465 [Clostridia bacterium]|nr:hypothetical protein [Clostridia bacterium]